MQHLTPKSGIRHCKRSNSPLKHKFDDFYSAVVDEKKAKNQMFAKR